MNVLLSVRPEYPRRFSPERKDTNFENENRRKPLARFLSMNVAHRRVLWGGLALEGYILALLKKFGRGAKTLAGSRRGVISHIAAAGRSFTLLKLMKSFGSIIL